MRRIVLSLTCSLLLAACAAGQNGSDSLAEGATPVPYHSPTPSRTNTLLPGLTEIVLPTSTPVLYTVVLGDTLGAIADRFDITLEALMAANPGVEPTALIVGMELVIPIGGTQPSQPALTPAPLEVSQARCWPESTGGWWCLAMVWNGNSETLENISAQFTLLDEDGEQLASQTAYGPLDILPPGAAMPLGIHFAPPMNPQVQLRVQVLSAIRLLPGDGRYLPTTLENTLVSVDTGGRTAQVTGQVMLTTLDGIANTLWVLASAYDEAGNLVGFRRWESDSQLAGGERVTFEMLVSSVGPAIEKVEFLVEARP